MKIFGPRPAKVFINEKEIAFSTTPLLGYAFLEMELFEFLNALDVEYIFDKEYKIIRFNGLSMQMEEGKDGLFEMQILKDGKLVDYVGNVKKSEGKYIGNLWLYSGLDTYLGYKIEFHFEDYSVRFVKR